MHWGQLAAFEWRLKRQTSRDAIDRDAIRRDAINPKFLAKIETSIDIKMIGLEITQRMGIRVAIPRRLPQIFSLFRTHSKF